MVGGISGEEGAMTFSSEQSALLAAPLSRSVVKSRKMAGRSMSYVEGWHVIAEANRIFGFDGWTSETILLQEANRDLVDLESDRGKYQQWRIGYIAKVRITAGGISREGTGYGSGMGKPEAVGDAVEGAIKEAETDARKRALMTFGNPFGLALYDKEQSEVEDVKPAPPPPKVDTPKPSMTPAQWSLKAQEELARLHSKADFTQWLQKNSAAIDRLLDVDKALYNSLQVKMMHRSDELEKVAA